MKVANYSEFRKTMKEKMDSVVKNAEVLIIHRARGKDVVIISLVEYNKLKETEYLLDTAANRRHLLEGIKELKAGKGVKVSKDKLWK